MTSSDFRNTISTSGPDQGESHSLTAPPALRPENGRQGTSLAGEGERSTWALPALASQQATPGVVAFPLSGSAFQTANKDHRKESVFSTPSGADDSATPPTIPDHSTPPSNRDTLCEAPRGSCKSEKGALVETHGMAFEETHEEESEPDENALPPREFGGNTSFAYGKRPMPQDVQGLGPGAAVQEVAGVYSLVSDFGPASFASSVKEPQHWNLFASSGFEMDPDAEIDTEADASTPMDEDKVQSFWSNTTFDPRLAYRPSPYIQDIEVEQSDVIIDNGLDFVEDLAMEDAEEDHQEVATTVAVTQTIQQPSLDTLVIPHIISNVQLRGSVQTTPLGSSSSAQSTMSSNLYTLYRVAPQNSSFVQAVPPQKTASLFVSDGTPSSTPMLEVETFKEQGIAVSNISPTPELTVVASHTTSHSSLSPSPASPSRDGSAPTSLSNHGAIYKHKREVEGLAVSVGPQPTVATIQCEGSPLGYVRISLVM
jgi:hypothetical protein